MKKIMLLILLVLVGCSNVPERKSLTICEVYQPMNMCNMTWEGDIECESISHSLNEWNENFDCSFVECEGTIAIEGKIFGACIKK